MNHLNTYLKGRHFTLIRDHKPLVALGKIHTKTLNRLHEAMTEFNFEIVYKKEKTSSAEIFSLQSSIKEQELKKNKKITPSSKL